MCVLAYYCMTVEKGCSSFAKVELAGVSVELRMHSWKRDVESSCRSGAFKGNPIQ